MEVIRSVLFRTVRTGFLKPGISFGCQSVACKSTDRRKNADKVGEGTKEHAKKHRMYAQINYEEWRYPQKHRAIDISSTPEIFKPYQDKDRGIKSRLSSPKQSLIDAKDKILHHRILKKRVPDFHQKRFPAEAQQIYIDAHNLLNTRRWTLTEREKTEEKLHNLVTELAYGEMVKGLETKTIIWNWLETIEPPSVVQILCAPMVNDNNFYSQVTVKMHSKQTLAVYDRFGRLIFGDQNIPRSVLEYVVFERHISHPYGKWRIHGKIDDGGYSREPVKQTIAFKQPHAQRTEADDWHKKEHEEHSYKWYPLRYKRIRHTEIMKRVRQGNKYWRSKRKKYILTVTQTPSVKMRGKAHKVVRKKKSSIHKMRQSGKLPYPPVGDAEPEF